MHHLIKFSVVLKPKATLPQASIIPPRHTPSPELTFSFKPALVLFAAYKPYYPGLTSISNKGTTGKSRRAGAHSPLSLTAKSKKGGHHTHTHGHPSPNDPRLHLPHHETRAEPESKWPFHSRRLCQDLPAITG